MRYEVGDGADPSDALIVFRDQHPERRGDRDAADLLRGRRGDDRTELDPNGTVTRDVTLHDPLLHILPEAGVERVELRHDIAEEERLPLRLLTVADRDRVVGREVAAVVARADVFGSRHARRCAYVGLD